MNDRDIYRIHTILYIFYNIISPLFIYIYFSQKFSPLNKYCNLIIIFNVCKSLTDTKTKRKLAFLLFFFFFYLICRNKNILIVNKDPSHIVELRNITRRYSKQTAELLLSSQIHRIEGVAAEKLVTVLSFFLSFFFLFFAGHGSRLHEEVEIAPAEGRISIASFLMAFAADPRRGTDNGYTKDISTSLSDVRGLRLMDEHDTIIIKSRMLHRNVSESIVAERA